MSIFRILQGFVLVWLLCVPFSVGAMECFDCHDAGKFKGEVVHKPVAEANCLVCHGAHVSRFEKLLKKKSHELCLECHQELSSELGGGMVLHEPVRKGECSSCHDPHAAEYGKLLSKTGGDLCFSCHEETHKTFTYSHKPYVDGDCSACHAAHGGSDSRLLKADAGGLCFSCHQDNKQLRSKHLGKDLSGVDCLSCHHPHGGESQNLLRAFSHKPFADKNCRACHDGENDFDNCLQCHEAVLGSFNYAHNHLGVSGSGNPCTSCHNPHVGDRKGLLPGVLGNVCKDCHADTFERRRKSLHKHENWENCNDCHNIHGSNHVAMLIEGQKVCNLCHDQHKGFTHPIGESAIDPRNNQAMDCLTCHNANDGTDYRYYLRGSAERGLCVQCHQGY
ncbi:cytochrome c3 family protein [Malonomonas rubra]|nr:cytochrome c3 family protein [Malonomonas rubra]